MLEFQEKRRLKNFLYSKITLVILLILIGVAVNAVWGIYQKQHMAKVNLAKTAAVYEGLQVREKMLSSEIERLKTEDGKEEEIREKYGLVKPGEEVIVIVDKDEATNSDQDSTDISFWQKVVDWLR
jgi:cell division protein FtsB